MRERRSGPCIQCLGERLREAGFAARGPLPTAPEPALLAALAAHDPGAGPLAPVLRLDGEQAYVHALLAVPDCPGCGSWPSGHDADPVPRAVLRDPLLGIVSELRRTVPGSDDSALCHGISARVHMPRIRDQVGVRGHGFAEEAAAQALLGEAVERYSALRPAAARVQIARAADLGPGEQLGGEAFGYSAAQRAAAGLVRLDSRHRIGWVRGERLRDGAPVWVPAAAAYLSRNWRPDEPRFAPQNSHGTATHVTAAQATERAILELWERRAMTQAWHAQDFGTALGARALTPAAHELGRRLREAGVTWQLSVLTRAPDPPVVMALLWREGAPWYLLGSAARNRVDGAAEAALLEAASGWQSLRESPEALLRRPRLPVVSDAAAHHRWHAGPRRSRVVIDAIVRGTRAAAVGPDAGNGTSPMDLMRRRAPDAVVVKLEAPDVAATGFHVHRVIAPDWPLFQFGRLGTPDVARAAAGWPVAPAPHPFR